MLALFCMTRLAGPRHARGSGMGHSDGARIEREIHTHLQAIALYEDVASSSDVQLRAFAQRILPQLQRRLALLQSLQAQNEQRDLGERDVPLDRRS